MEKCVENLNTLVNLDNNTAVHQMLLLQDIAVFIACVWLVNFSPVHAYFSVTLTKCCQL